MKCMLRKEKKSVRTERKKERNVKNEYEKKIIKTKGKIDMYPNIYIFLTFTPKAQTYIYIYIYRERERDREGERGRETETERQREGERKKSMKSIHIWADI